jgi:hypothetical protein
MPVKRTIPVSSGMFFITFTCYRWLPLIERANGYDLVYNWFNLLKRNGHYINGYVVMPNHLHAMISFVNIGKNINSIVGNGKRFMAYEIISRLGTYKECDLLDQLAIGIEPKRIENKKRHNVWELSFDWKECIGSDFIWQKLNYMHANPCQGKWSLAVNDIEYPHSSAKYYLTGEQGEFPVTDFTEMMDISFESN